MFMNNKGMRVALISVSAVLVLGSLYGGPQDKGRFPPFITLNKDYFVTRIGALPKIAPAAATASPRTTRIPRTARMSGPS